MNGDKYGSCNGTEYHNESINKYEYVEYGPAVGLADSSAQLQLFQTQDDLPLNRMCNRNRQSI